MIDKDQELFLDYIKQLLYNTDEATLCRDELSDDVTQLADGIEYLGEVIKDEKNVLSKMAQGEVDEQFSISHNYLAAPVKSIQSNLKHLSWVAQRVAAGDYKQHVSSLGSFSDSFNEMIDQLSHYREKMEHISNTDVLTGIANRRAFNQMIKKLWDKDIPCAIVFIDIDGLKYVNDNYGHSGGNRYIKEVCQILKMNLKEDEFIFRIGGDELLILSKKEDAHICEERLLEIRLQFREEMKKKVPYPCDFSFGCVDIDKKENKTISEYLSLADKKIYHFKMQHYIEQRRPKYSNHIDKSGLDSRIFDAFSQTSINRYAYICNMETNVSRWSVQAVKDFDLPYEYMYDAGKIWEEHIHPDDCKEYEEDIEAVFSGKKECHDLTYRIRLKNGKYIKCRCEGYVLRGRTAKEPNLFVGILTRVDKAVNYEER